MGLPDWLEPIREGASTITAEDISRFVPPPGSDARKGAVLMLFGEGPNGPDRSSPSAPTTCAPTPVR